MVTWLVLSALSPAAEHVASGNANIWVSEAADPKGVGPEALVTKWIQQCGAADHATIVEQRNVLGLVPVDLLDGLAWLAKASPRLGDRSVVIERLKQLVADPKRPIQEREVAIIGLLYLSRDSQSIDLALDHLLAQGDNEASNRVLTYILNNCVLTIEQRSRSGARSR